MASQVNNIGTTAVIILILTIFFGAWYYVSLEVSDKNTRLDSNSVQTIENLGANYANSINDTSFIVQGGDFNDSTFDGVDPFVRQYLEDKSEIEQKQTLLNKILLYPSIIISVFGVSDMRILVMFSSLVFGFITFLLTLQVIKAIKGEVD